jgi:flagellar protein FlbD
LHSLSDKEHVPVPTDNFMIHLTRINHVPLVLNSDVIEHIEMTPDTVISLTTGQKLVVLESSDEVIQRVIEFRRAISQGQIARQAG